MINTLLSFIGFVIIFACIASYFSLSPLWTTVPLLLGIGFIFSS